MATNNTTISLENLMEIIQTQKQTLEDLQNDTDVFFVLIMSCIIFFMQCGFAFLECGAVRSKNTTNILMKNMLDVFIGGIAYWAVGYAFAFGEGNFYIGHSYWFSAGLPDDKYHAWFFHFVFAATATTIVSGALAERCEFSAYITYSIVITGFVYPVASHWAWSTEGWLGVGIDGVSYQDFAGSGVVHLLGGTAALVGAALLGPRTGRFDKETGKPCDIPGHSVPLAALGGFILLFGFFAFNGGSQFSISKAGDGYIIARAILNTTIAGSFAACTALIIGRLKGCRKCDGESVANWSLLTTINGALTGMVAICAPCNVFEPWASAVTGIIAALSFLMWKAIVIRAKIDDPLDAVAVHLGGGLWGVLSVAIFKRGDGIVYTFSTDAWKSFGINLLGAVVIMAWSGVICFLMFGVLRLFKMLRVSDEVEMKGLDIPKHGEPAYPYQSYGDGWGEYSISLANVKELATHIYPNGNPPPEYTIQKNAENGVNNDTYVKEEDGRHADVKI